MRAIKICVALAFAALSASGALSLRDPAFVASLGSASGGSAGDVPPVSGFSLWVHADDSTGMFTNTAMTAAATADNAHVAAWKDRSTAGTNSLFMLAGNGESRPFLSNSWFNGKPALIFGDEANGQYLQTATNKVLWGSTGLTWFAVAQNFDPTGGGSQFGMLLTLGAAVNPFIEMRRLNLSTNVEMLSGNGTTSIGGPGYRTSKGYAWCGWSKNGTLNNVGIYRNGAGSLTSDASGGSFWPNTNGFGVARRWAPNNNVFNLWHGAIAEVIVYPWPLSTLEISNVNFYLTNKYALHDP